jgi:hypothetical protein
LFIKIRMYLQFPLGTLQIIDHFYRMLNNRLLYSVNVQLHSPVTMFFFSSSVVKITKIMLIERRYVLMYVQYLTLKSVNYWKITLTSENSALMWEKSAFLWKIHWKMTPKPLIFFKTLKLSEIRCFGLNSGHKVQILSCVRN